jgi:hypothetical protein
MIHSFAKILCAALLVAALPATHAAELDPKAVVYKLPDQIKWVPSRRRATSKSRFSATPASRVSTACSSDDSPAIISAGRISIRTTASSL